MLKYFTIIGDPHLTHKSIDRVKGICERVEKQGHPCIWLGDMLDTKEIIRGKCQNFWIDYFSTSKVTHYVLVGNHDYFNLECEDHSLAFLKTIKNVILVDKPMDFINTPFYMIPYIHDQKKLKQALKEGPINSVLIGHLELKGFDFGNGHICEEGLTLRSLKQYKRVISGHFHKYQHKGSLTYLGTPFSHSFGESNQDKFIGSYCVETDTLKILDTELPQHLTIELDCDEIARNSGDEMQHMFLNMEDSLYAEHYYRIILVGQQKNIDKFPISMYRDNPACKLNIKFLSRPSDSVLNTINIKDTVSNQEQFIEWASSVKKMSKGTTALGLKILEAARVK